MLEQVTKCHPPETRFNNCTSQQSPWCGWYCTWAVHVPQPDRAAVPRGLTGCNIGHHSDAWVPSWPLESGLFSFVWINPWQFLDALGRVEEAPEWGCPQQLLGSPVGFSSFHPQALPGKLEVPFLLGICRPQASGLLGHPSPRQVRKAGGIPSVVSCLWQEIRDQSKLIPDHTTGLRSDSQTDTQRVVELKASSLSLCLSRVYKHPLEEKMW